MAEGSLTINLDSKTIDHPVFHDGLAKSWDECCGFERTFFRRSVGWGEEFQSVPKFLSPSLSPLVPSAVFWLAPFLPRTIPTSLAAQWICPKIAAFYKWAGQLFCFGFLRAGIWVISSSSTAQAPHFRAGGRQLFFSSYCLSILCQPVSTSQGMLGRQWQVH